MPSDAFVIVGILGRPCGLTGELHVTLQTDFPERFEGLKEIYVRYRDRWEKRGLASSRLVSGRPVLRFENVTTPEAAARLTNRELAVPRDETVALPDNTYYVFDLIGCRVLEEGTDRIIGHVIDVERCPANDVYVIEDAQKKVLRCPVVKSFVRQVDIRGRRIRIVAAGLFSEQES